MTTGRRFLSITALCSFFLHADAYHVVKNINNGPQEKKVVFDIRTPKENVVLEDREGGCKTGFTESGAIEVFIAGKGAVQPTVAWTPASRIPGTIDARKYGYLILRCALEGDIQRTYPDGRIAPYRPDDLWFSVSLFTAANERIGIANLAAVAKDGKTPDRMTTLTIPMSALIDGTSFDVSKVAAVGFRWGPAGETHDRRFRLVIEEIAFAN